MTYTRMRFDKDGWPLLWPDYIERVPSCDTCKHPTSYHGMHIKDGRVSYVCNICGCVRGSHDAESR